VVSVTKWSKRVLTGTLQVTGFASVASMGRAAPYFDLWAVGSKKQRTEEAMKQLAKMYFTPV